MTEPRDTAAVRGAAVAQVLVAAALFGTTGTAQALGPDDTTPLGVGAVRLVVGGAVLLAALPISGSRIGDAARLWRTPYGLVAGVCAATYQVCFFTAVAWTGVAMGTLVTIGSGPLLAGLLSWLLLRERPTRAWAVATGITGTGLAVLFLDSADVSGASAAGILLAAGAGLSYAAYTVLSRALIQGGAASDTVMAATFAAGGVLLLPLLAFQPVQWLATGPGFALAVYLGVGTTTVAYLFFGRGLRVLPAAPVATLVLAEPLVATLLGVLVLGETLAAAAVVGAVLILSGVGLQGFSSARGTSATPSPKA